MTYATSTLQNRTKLLTLQKDSTRYIAPFKVASRILMFDAIVLALTNTEYGKVAPTTEVYRQADN